MRFVLAIILALQLLLAFVFPANTGAQAKTAKLPDLPIPPFPKTASERLQTETEELIGRVILYNSILHTRTANEDMVVLLNGNGGFIRLLYSPYDFGFDAPRAHEDQLLPQEMFTNTKLTWKFRVHPARNGEEEAQCSSLSKIVVLDKKGPSRRISAYPAVRGNESIVVPPLKSLPCRIIMPYTVNRILQ